MIPRPAKICQDSGSYIKMLPAIGRWSRYRKDTEKMKKTEIMVNGARMKKLRVPPTPISPIDEAVMQINETIDKITDLQCEMLTQQERILTFVEELRDRIYSNERDLDEAELNTEELELALVEHGIIKPIHDIDADDVGCRRWLIDEKM